MLLIPVPINSLAWTVGSIVMFYLSWRLLVNWRRTDNTFSKLFGSFTFLIAAALALFSYPVWFTHNQQVLLAFSFAGEAGLYSAYLVMTYVVWYIYLKYKISVAWLLIPGALVATGGWIAYMTGVELLHSSEILFFRYPQLGGLGHALFLGGISLPFGLLLIKQGVGEISQRNWAAVAKSLTWGGMTIVLSVSFVYFMYVGRGYVPPLAAYLIIITYIFFFAALIMPASERKLQSQTTQLAEQDSQLET